ncbi:hypothetical protein [Saccharolobus shibatae]|uniref:hypothetical protein n=1 Tax=Saccharolobus shibatae TaxID=2286 RepID=UPI001C48BB8B|nr:hypothetical protein [Saccharolobus shibatae]
MTSIYKFKPVFFIREFDITSLVQKTKEIANLNNKKIEDMFSDAKLNEFIKLHSSWDNVANAIDLMIKNFI